MVWLSACLASFNYERICVVWQVFGLMAELPGFSRCLASMMWFPKPNVELVKVPGTYEVSPLPKCPS